MVNPNENKNAKLLNFVYQNSAMGVQTITQLLDITDSEAMRKHLRYELERYNHFHAEARSRLNECGYDDEGLTGFEKVRTYVMISAQTLTDRSPQHIAEMLITGSTMGIIDAVKNLKHNADAEKEARDLMLELLKFEEDNAVRLREFL